jgi:UDP-N-acetylglucosamine 2-epimerase (non-hydrolysing)
MIAIVLGTRPEIIKMSPLIRACESMGLDYFVIHTGQHYSFDMDKIFFGELQLPLPKFNLDIGSGTHGEQTGKIMMGSEAILSSEKPDVVLVQGDTNTVLAGSLAAAKLSIPVGHVEAGLRSFDKNMPEELNRIVADHVSDFLYAPTNGAKENLLREGIEREKIIVTGNTIVDAIYQNSKIARLKSDILERLNLRSKDYFLVTLHRQENVDDRSRLKEILKGLELIRKCLSKPVIFPIHPRTRKMLDNFELCANGIEIIDPIGFLDFLQMESNARIVLTDSGGVQEETCILGTPCVTLRETTERPETLEVSSNILAGIQSQAIVDATKSQINNTGVWKNPFGEGKAGKHIIDHISREFSLAKG